MSMSNLVKSGSIVTQLDTAQQALVDATDNFERARIRDHAKAIQAAAAILKRRDVQVTASVLVASAEREYDKHRKREQGKRNDLTSVPQGTEVVPPISKKVEKDIAAAHSKLSDEEFEARKVEAVETETPLTRAALKETGKVIQKEKAREEKQQRDTFAVSEMAKKAIEDKVKLHTCMIADLDMHVEPESVDLILTDPPYPKEYLNCWSELQRFAEHALKPGGSLLAMSGKAWLPEVMQRLGAGDLVYRWQLILTLQSGTGIINRGITRSLYKPFLWYTKGETETRRHLIDVIQGSGKDKEHHAWGQSVEELTYLIEKLTDPGEVICDPFLGGGTTAVAAFNLNRQFIGADIDAKCVEKTQTRIEEGESL